LRSRLLLAAAFYVSIDFVHVEQQPTTNAVSTNSALLLELVNRGRSRPQVLCNLVYRQPFHGKRHDYNGD